MFSQYKSIHQVLIGKFTEYWVYIVHYFLDLNFVFIDSSSGLTKPGFVYIID